MHRTVALLTYLTQPTSARETKLRAIPGRFDMEKLIRAGDPAPGTSPERFTRMLDAAQYLADHIHEAPVWIVPCMQGANPTRTAGSSIYPAIQNMLLAARALGLLSWSGTVLFVCVGWLLFFYPFDRAVQMADQLLWR